MIVLLLLNSALLLNKDVLILNFFLSNMLKSNAIDTILRSGRHFNGMVGWRILYLQHLSSKMNLIDKVKRIYNVHHKFSEHYSAKFCL